MAPALRFGILAARARRYGALGLVTVWVADWFADAYNPTYPWYEG